METEMPATDSAAENGASINETDAAVPKAEMTTTADPSPPTNDAVASAPTAEAEVTAPPLPPNNDAAAPKILSHSERTSCACNKTKCLKLYCDCFSNGQHCGDNCQCNDCHNDETHKDERIEAIKTVLDRKPDAFNDEIKRHIGWVPEEKPTTGKKRGRPKGSLNKNRCITIDIEPTPKRPRGRPRKDAINNPPIQSLPPPSQPLPYTEAEYPQLTLDTTTDYSHLASSFTRPLFPPSDPPTSKPLQIAYSHHASAQHERTVAQNKKNVVLSEYQKIREKYLEKKLELSLANDEMQRCDKNVGMWTKKVFDLELVEPCEWNENLERLGRYMQENKKLPPRNVWRCKEGEEREISLWLEKMRGNKVQESETDNAEEINEGKSSSQNTTTPKKQPKIDLTDYPHRIDALKAYNIHFQEKTQNKFETMFQKLIDYKEEHGTLRFPSDDQCAASGDEEFIALQKWVKSQVLNFRYNRKKTDPAILKRFVDIGFSFDRWYAKPGKKKSENRFDEIAKSEVEGVDGEGDDDENIEMEEGGDGDEQGEMEEGVNGEAQGEQPVEKEAVAQEQSYGEGMEGVQHQQEFIVNEGNEEPQIHNQVHMMENGGGSGAHVKNEEQLVENATNIGLHFDNDVELMVENAVLQVDDQQQLVENAGNEVSHTEFSPMDV